MKVSAVNPIPAMQASIEDAPIVVFGTTSGSGDVSTLAVGAVLKGVAGAELAVACGWHGTGVFVLDGASPAAVLVDPGSSALTPAAVRRVLAGGSIRFDGPTIDELRAAGQGADCVAFATLTGDPSGTATTVRQVMRVVRCDGAPPAAGATVRVPEDAAWDLGRDTSTGYLLLDRASDGSWQLRLPPRILAPADEEALGWASP